MSKFDLVPQKDKWGCGVACVASLLGIDYADAKSMLELEKGKSVNARPQGLELHHIALALGKNGVEVVADWFPESFPVGTIACIGGEAPYDGHHYLLQTPHGWMDPWFNLEPGKMEAGYHRVDFPPKGVDFLVALVPKRVIG